MKHACSEEMMLSLMAELIARDDTYSIRQLARDEDIIKSGTICGAFSIHLKTIAPYVKRYGYETINNLVLETARTMTAGKEEANDDRSTRDSAENESVSEIISY